MGQPTARKAAEAGGADARDRILAAAYALFFRQGLVQATPAAVAERAGVPQAAVRLHFGGRDGLLRAVLEVHSALLFARMRQRAERLPADPLAAVDALFAALASLTDAPAFEGAGGTRVAMQLADVGRQRPAISRHRIVFEVWLADQLAARGMASPNESARRITALMEDSIALMLIHGERSSVRSAARAARRMLTSGDS